MHQPIAGEKLKRLLRLGPSPIAGWAITSATYSVAACAHIYWPAGLKHTKNQAKAHEMPVLR